MVTLDDLLQAIETIRAEQRAQRAKAFPNLLRSLNLPLPATGPAGSSKPSSPVSAPSTE